MSHGSAQALVFRIPGAFPNTKPVDEQSVADVGGIVRSIKTMVAHQRVKAVDAPREKRDAPPKTRECPAVSPTVSFDHGHWEWHPTPTGPPSVSRIKPLDQHRARLPLDSHPRLSEHRGEGKTRG